MLRRSSSRAMRARGINRANASRARANRRRTLSIEPLEVRELLAVFTVSNLMDAPVAAAGDAPGTLRQAIFDALNNATAGDEIEFAAGLTGTITLTEGELLIDEAMTITGPGAQLLSIDASGSDPTPAMNNGDGSRVFHIDDGVVGTDSPVTISGLTITGGDASTSGGGIRSLESLALIDSVVTGNATQNDGGGVFASTSAGAITITRSRITGNATAAAGDAGGGTYAYTAAGTTTISDSTFSDNESHYGGGLFSETMSGTVSISGSTFSGNQVVQNGGGIASYTDTGTTTIINSTISGNGADNDGGGLLATTAAGGTTTLANSTITENGSDTNMLGAGSGGGVYGAGLGTLAVNHTIIANNTDFTGTAFDLDATSAAMPPALSVMFSLIGADTGSGLAAAPVGMPDAMGNLIGTLVAPIDPFLSALANHGGPTATHRLIMGSPAIDTGNPAIAMPPSSDQRGAPFVRIFDGDGIGGALIDIGSFERQTLAALNLVVDTLVDENDGDYSPGDLSLREAVGLANGSVGADTITFAPALSNGTITLVLGELNITEELTIDSSSLAIGIKIDAAGNDPTPMTDDGMGSRIFNINDNNGATDSAVTLINVTLTGGDISGNGGAIQSFESLALIDSVITGNAASGVGGGGIYWFRSTGTLSILRSTVSDNTALGGAIGGGGIYFDSSGSAVLTITDSTISGNSTDGDGGGVFASSLSGTITITDSTFNNNFTLDGTGDSDGGGLFADTDSGTIDIINSTFSANMADDSGGGAILISGPPGTTTVRHSTFTLNVADSNTGGVGSGGGIRTAGDGAFVLEHTIIAENTGPNPDLDITTDAPGSATIRFNLLGINDGSGLPPGFPDANGNLIGTAAIPVDPQLEALADNGGPTQTHALMMISPAIDRGDPAAIAGIGTVPEFDQRGDPFLRVLDGDGILGPRIDIGAFEFPEIILPDEFEPNNSIGTATVLGSLPEITLRDLTIHNAIDQDFFKVTANQTGKLIVRALFTHAAGDLDLEVQDMFGNVISSSVGTVDNELIIIPVVSQEMYFIRVFGFGGAINTYSLEIENFAAPVPTAIHLDPASDVIPPLGDNIISDTSPTFFVHVDVLNFVDPDGNGTFDIPVLTAAEAAMMQPGIAVEVRLVNTTDPTQPPIIVFADPISLQFPTVYRVNVAGPLPDGVYFVSAATRIFDGQGNALGQPEPATGRSDLSPPLWFTIDTPFDFLELGVWAAGTVLIDANGNFYSDPADRAFHLGFSSDYIFAGNFAAMGAMANGFDKLAAYGRVGNQFRWMIDTTGDGVPDLIINDPANINGIPVAGNFDGNSANGDEVGLFTGNAWHLDTNHDFRVDSMYTAQYDGFPIAGDFDGDGDDDLGTYIASQAGGNQFSVDLNVPAMTGRLHVDGIANRTFRIGSPPIMGASGFFGFPGVRERPVAADMNRDGVDDIGLWVPDGTALVPGDKGEWFFLVSNNNPLTMAIENTVLDRIAGGFVSFTPAPFGNDIYAQFGNSFALPVVGNFVPLPTPNDVVVPPPPIIVATSAPTAHATTANATSPTVKIAKTTSTPSATPASPTLVAPTVSKKTDPIVAANPVAIPPAPVAAATQKPAATAANVANPAIVDKRVSVAPTKTPATPPSAPPKPTAPIVAVSLPSAPATKVTIPIPAVTKETGKIPSTPSPTTVVTAPPAETSKPAKAATVQQSLTVGPISTSVLPSKQVAGTSKTYIASSQLNAQPVAQSTNVAAGLAKAPDPSPTSSNGKSAKRPTPTVPSTVSLAAMPLDKTQTPPLVGAKKANAAVIEAIAVAANAVEPLAKNEPTKSILSTELSTSHAKDASAEVAEPPTISTPIEDPSEIRITETTVAAAAETPASNEAVAASTDQQAIELAPSVIDVPLDIVESDVNGRALDKSIGDDAVSQSVGSSTLVPEATAIVEAMPVIDLPSIETDDKLSDVVDEPIQFAVAAAVQHDDTARDDIESPQRPEIIDATTSASAAGSEVVDEIALSATAVSKSSGALTIAVTSDNSRGSASIATNQRAASKPESVTLSAKFVAPSKVTTDVAAAMRGVLSDIPRNPIDSVSPISRRVASTAQQIANKAVVIDTAFSDLLLAVNVNRHELANDLIDDSFETVAVSEDVLEDQTAADWALDHWRNS